MKSIIKNVIILTLTGMVALFGCLNMGDEQLNTNLIDTDNGGCSQIIIDENKYNAATSDEYIIDYAFINNDTLNMIVQYGGGCGAVSFKLLMNGYFMESDPVQLDVLLSLKDEDPCEALIKRSICFDLSELATLYNDSYQTEEGTIIIRIKYYSTLEYDF